MQNSTSFPYSTSSPAPTLAPANVGQPATPLCISGATSPAPALALPRKAAKSPSPSNKAPRSAFVKVKVLKNGASTGFVLVLRCKPRRTYENHYWYRSGINTVPGGGGKTSVSIDSFIAEGTCCYCGGHCRNGKGTLCHLCSTTAMQTAGLPDPATLKAIYTGPEVASN